MRKYNLGTVKNDKAVDLEIEVANLQKEFQARTSALLIEINSKKRELEDLRRDGVLGALASQGYKNLDAIGIGDWDCELSPIGTCVYDMDSVYGEDDCLFCHKPDERK